MRGLASENLHKTGHRRLWTQAGKRSRRWPYLNEIALRRSCSFLPAMLTSRVVKRATITAFVVEPTNFGWSVLAGTQRMPLFVSQRQALEDFHLGCLQFSSAVMHSFIEQLVLVLQLQMK